MTQVMAPACERCGGDVPPYALMCTHCGGLRHRAELERLSHEAMTAEPFDPAGAAARWRRCLELLPPNSPQYVAIYHRLSALLSGAGFPLTAGQNDYSAYHHYSHSGAPQHVPPSASQEPLGSAIAKTIGSMIISILVYTMLFAAGGSLLDGLVFATGFVVLILIHELGHVAAMRYYGLSASPPIFIPFLGALINLRQPPQNAKVEAVVGIGGPIAGTLGALVVYAMYLYLPQGSAASDLAYILACIGFLLNLFNLLPVPPLDGGRITAAVSPKIWLLGLVGLAALAVQAVMQGNGMQVGMLLLVLFFAYPRVISTLARRDPDNPYYAITRRASWTIGVLYVILGGVLTTGFMLTKDAMNF